MVLVVRSEEEDEDEDEHGGVSLLDFVVAQLQCDLSRRKEPRFV